MKYNITKELFEAVMSLKVIEFYCRNEIQYYPADKERVRCIDWIPTLSGCEYNDFFFKCKEWALGQGYEIFTSGIKCSVYKISKGCIIDQLESTSEQQVVFDACQWVLDNKEK